MADAGWTRRAFLTVTAETGVVLLWSPPAVAGWLASGATGSDGPSLPKGYLGDLARSAPRARYWVSASQVGSRSECLACHEGVDLPADISQFAHREPWVRCQLRAQNCMIALGDRGRCRARMNVDGELRSLVYGRPISVHVDPIEKKPFFHFLPGTPALSLATSGCPLRCRFCQNWEISQASPEDFRADYIPPETIVSAALEKSAPIVSFTYNEPTVFTEYLTDIARAGRPGRCRSVVVSCGFMNEAPLAEMCEVLEGIKIDLKGFSEDFYRDVCGAELQPVLRSIRQVAASGTHLEIVNLVVPTLNDSTAMLTELAKWVAGEVGGDVPVHFTRFHPDYQLRNLPPTPVSTLEKAREIAMEQGVRYAYIGNVPGHPGNNTFCAKCGKVVIERRGFFVLAMHLQNGTCEFCGNPIPGVWS